MIAGGRRLCRVGHAALARPRHRRLATRRCLCRAAGLLAPGHRSGAGKNPDAWFVGEVIHGDFPEFVQQGGLDSVTQYELWKSTWSSLNDGNFFELDWTLKRHLEFCQVFVPMTFIGNHDVTRIASQLTDPRLLPHALVVLFTVPGVPSIYYGDEQAFRGEKQDREGGDDVIRPAFPADPSGLADDGRPIYRLHQDLIGLRRRETWLSTARIETITLANQQLSFRAFDDGGHQPSCCSTAPTTSSSSHSRAVDSSCCWTATTRTRPMTVRTEPAQSWGPTAGRSSGRSRRRRPEPPGGRVRGAAVAQPAAFFTSSPILFSSAAVNVVSAKAVGHMVPSSRFAASLKPSVAYLALNFFASWKKQTTLPSLAYAGIPYQVSGEVGSAGRDDGVDPLGHLAIRSVHLADLGENVALPVLFGGTRATAGRLLELLTALFHGGAFVLGEPVVRLRGRGAALGGLLGGRHLQCPLGECCSG